MLKALFRWLDATPGFYWACAIGSLILFVSVLVRLFLVVQVQTAGKRGPVDAVFWAGVAVVLSAWRWPFLLAAGHFNPDESQLIAGAITLKRDWVFWRSVDGATAGPLDFFALWPLHFLGVPLDFFGARLTALVLIWGTIVACYQTLKVFYKPEVAALACLPMLVIYAFVTQGDFLHYSTETLPIFLVAWAWYFILSAKADRRQENQVSVKWFWAGLCLGCLPWAKLQGAPIAAAVFVFALFLIFRQGRSNWNQSSKNGLRASLGIVTPSVFWIGMICSFGLWSDFYTSYIEHNLFYQETGSSFPEVMHGFLGYLGGDPTVPFFFCVSISIIVGLLLGKRTLRDHLPSVMLGGAILWMVVCCYVVLAPHRGFPHYLVFLFVPMGLLCGLAFAAWAARVGEVTPRRVIHFFPLLGIILIGVVPALIFRLRQPSPFMIGLLARDWANPRNEVSQVIVRYRQPGDTLGMWGWFPQVYVETNLAQATRDAHSQTSIDASPFGRYYQKRYLKDLASARPAVFVDAVGRNAFAYTDRDSYGHEMFPALDDFVKANYRLVKDCSLARVYVRVDRFMEKENNYGSSSSGPKSSGGIR